MIRRMRLRLLGVALAIISLGMAATAISLASGLHASFGDVGTWLSGIGSFAAAVAALKIAGDETRRYNNDKAVGRREAQERAMRRAKRITFEVGGGSQMTHDYIVHVVALHNAGNSPIYDLTWYPPVIVAERSATLTTVFRIIEIDSEDGEPPKPTFLNPDKNWPY
jgi:hypothetical protein